MHLLWNIQGALPLVWKLFDAHEPEFSSCVSCLKANMQGVRTQVISPEASESGFKPSATTSKPRSKNLNFPSPTDSKNKTNYKKNLCKCWYTFFPWAVCIEANQKAGFCVAQLVVSRPHNRNNVLMVPEPKHFKDPGSTVWTDTLIQLSLCTAAADDLIIKASYIRLDGSAPTRSFFGSRSSFPWAF